MLDAVDEENNDNLKESVNVNNKKQPLKDVTHDNLNMLSVERGRDELIVKSDNCNNNYNVKINRGLKEAGSDSKNNVSRGKGEVNLNINQNVMNN